METTRTARKAGPKKLYEPDSSTIPKKYWTFSDASVGFGKRSEGWLAHVRIFFLLIYVLLDIYCWTCWTM
jgi:hypothetical protein